jgi:hypothetical protein
MYRERVDTLDPSTEEINNTVLAGATAANLVLIIEYTLDNILEKEDKDAILL